MQVKTLYLTLADREKASTTASELEEDKHSHHGDKQVVRNKYRIKIKVLCWRQSFQENFDQKEQEN